MDVHLPFFICSVHVLIQNKTSLAVWLHLFVHHFKYWSTTRLRLKPAICLFFKQTAVSVPLRLLSYNSVVLARGSVFAQQLHNHLFFNFLCYHGNLAPAHCDTVMYPLPSLKSNSLGPWLSMDITMDVYNTVLSCPVNSASADPVLTPYRALSSVSYTIADPPSPPPSHILLWLGPENDQHSESNGKLKTPPCYCFHLLWVVLGKRGSYFTPLHRWSELSSSVCVSIISSPVEVCCLCYYTSVPSPSSSAKRFKNQN